MARQRREFSEEFKAEAVALVIGTGHPVAHVARDLGINEGTLGNALDMAIRRRQPTGRVILHSDRGSVYTSDQLARYARTHRLRLSVGATGVCWDALAESFFGMLKNELVHRQSWPTRARLRTALVTWIEGFYNARRRHSALGMISPDAYAQRLRYLVAA